MVKNILTLLFSIICFIQLVDSDLNHDDKNKEKIEKDELLKKNKSLEDKKENKTKEKPSKPRRPRFYRVEVAKKDK